MNYEKSLELLTSQEKFHINLGLERMKKIAQLFSNPQNSLKIVHVAGTNGKGSVCAMLAKILEENGYKTGLYTSPHIKSYNERIKINFENISEKDFADYLERVENTAKNNDVVLTEFEILTMMAFLYFYEKNTDVVIMETGMGGRLDATNIISKPILTIITSISKDHTDRLGSTISEIAAEKAGIIKQGVPVIVSSNNAGFDVILNTAPQKSAKLLAVEKNFSLIDTDKNIFSDGEKELEISLRGTNQGENLALVIKACEFLNLKYENALKNVVWQSRFEYKKEKNLVIDAAHNPDGLRLLNENINVYFKGKKRAFLFGMLDTKDYKTAIKNIFKNDDTVFVTDGFAQNALNKEILEEEIKKFFPDIKSMPLAINDIKRFKELDFQGIKVCCGSFYLTSKIY